MEVRILLLAIVLLLAGCSAPQTQESAIKKIEESERALYGEDENFKFDEALARKTIDDYDAFVKNYPESEKAPEILFKSADLHRALKEYQSALEIYKRVESEYSEYSKAPHSIFLQGFVYENELFRLEKAKECYESFLKKYPDHELADDVEFSLRNLGKSPEEIIRQFESQQAEIDTLVTPPGEI